MSEYAKIMNMTIQTLDETSMNNVSRMWIFIENQQEKIEELEKKIEELEKDRNYYENLSETYIQDSIDRKDVERHYNIQCEINIENEKKIEELEKKLAEAVEAVKREIREYGKSFELVELLNILEEKEGE